MNHPALGWHVRSIPAWAGEPSSVISNQSAATVYPRVGGGTQLRHIQPERRYGLSPRGRGNRAAARLSPCPPRSIPAWAGEPCEFALDTYGDGVYPRVGGGTPLRSIPAWAGAC